RGSAHASRSASVIASPSGTSPVCSVNDPGPPVKTRGCHFRSRRGSSRSNTESRQCSLKFLDSRVRDLGVHEMQCPQALEFLQFCIRDLGVDKVQPLQALEFLQLLQPCVRDLGAAKVQPLQALEFLQLLQPCVCDLCGCEVQPLQALEPLQLLQPGVRGLGEV